MRVSVAFDNEQLELDVPEERVVAEWKGPAPLDEGGLAVRVQEALEQPLEYPPLRRAVVPGDHVVIAFDAETPSASALLSAIVDILKGAGVDPESITVLLTSEAPPNLKREAPVGCSLVVHDPSDRAQLAYLASTSEGRRVYLNRLLTDADFVLPVGRLGYDPILGYRGPWSVLFPGLSDAESLKAYRALASERRPDRDRPRPALTESAEVSWLLGCQFQLGVVPGASGLGEVLAGLDAAVREQGMSAVDRAWSFEAESRAELVVVGVGEPGRRASLAELAQGLATATQFVQRGGKIVALSRAEGSLGPALRRLIEADDPRAGPAALRGHEADVDFNAARQVARAVAWADVYLLSGLPEQDVEDLAMIALDRPEEARRLVASTGSCMLVSRAELTRPRVAGEDD